MIAIRRLLNKLRNGHVIAELRAMERRQKETPKVWAIGPFYIDPGELADALEELRALGAGYAALTLPGAKDYPSG